MKDFHNLFIFLFICCLITLAIFPICNYLEEKFDLENEIYHIAGESIEIDSGLIAKWNIRFHMISFLVQILEKGKEFPNEILTIKHLVRDTKKEMEGVYIKFLQGEPYGQEDPSDYERDASSGTRY